MDKSQTKKIFEIIIAEAKKAGVDPYLMLRIANAESNFDPNTTDSVSGKHKGLFQFNPNTFTSTGERIEDILDPAANARAAAKLIANGGLRNWYYSAGLWAPDEETYNAALSFIQKHHGENSLSYKYLTRDWEKYKGDKPTLSGRNLLEATTEYSPEATESASVNVSPTPTVTPVQSSVTPFQPQIRRTPLISPDPNIQTIPKQPSLVEKMVDGYESAKDKFSDYFKGFGTYQVNKGFGERNTADIYSGGINRGTDFAMSKGTPVTLPQGNWKVIDAFSGATAEGPNNKQRGINQGYGNSVFVQNLDTGERLRFSHLSKVNVQRGQTLKGGLVGETGATGNVAGKTGQHLDLEYFDSKGKLADVRKSSYFNPQQQKMAKQSMPVATPQRIMQAQKPVISPVKQVVATASQPKQVTQFKPVSGGQSLVKTGDTLGALAKKFNTSLQTLLRMNPEIKNPNKIYVGQAVRTPSLPTKKIA